MLYCRHNKHFPKTALYRGKHALDLFFTFSALYSCPQQTIWELQNIILIWLSHFCKFHHRITRQVFKGRLDEALSNLIWWKMSLLMAGEMEPDDL